MGSGSRITAGPANDARCVCEADVLSGGRVQVKAQPGGGPREPVAKLETAPPYPYPLLTWAILCRGKGHEKNKISHRVRGFEVKNGSLTLKCFNFKRQ